MANWLQKFNPFRQDEVETKAAVPAAVNAVQPGGLFSAMLNGAEITPQIAWSLYQNSSTFAKVVDLIADEVARLEPQVKINGEVVEDHPILLFLAKPGCNRTRQRFIKELAVQYLVTGTCYPIAYGNTLRADVPIMMDIAKSMFVSINPDTDMWPRDYYYSEGSQSQNFTRDRTNPRDFRWLGLETGANLIPGEAAFSEIVPIYDMDGNRRGVGLPRLNAIKHDVELRLKGIRHNTALMDNNARLSGVMNVKIQMDPDDQASFQRDLNSQISGPENAGRVLVTTGGDMDFTQLSQSAKDMDFAKLIEIVEDAIVARYNVPITLFRTTAQTNNNYETAWKFFYNLAALPCFQVVYSGLAQLFSNRLGVQVEIVHNALSNPVLQEQAIKQATELYNAHLISRNEAREIFGYEPVVGGDTIYGSISDVPQAEDYFTNHGINDPSADNSRAAYHDLRPEDDPVVQEAANADARAAAAARHKPKDDKKPKKPAKKAEEATAVLLEFAQHLKSWKPQAPPGDKRAKAA